MSNSILNFDSQAMKDELALRIKLGDEQALELLFRKYYVRLCCFANKFLNDPEEAADIVQDVFTKLWESRKDLDPDQSLNAYIFKITQNNSINRLRRKQVESKYVEIYRLVYIDYPQISPYETLLSHELDNSITSALSKLPQNCRRIFELSRLDGLKYNEIASTLKISIKTVEGQMSKALRILRFELRNYL